MTLCTIYWVSHAVCIGGPQTEATVAEQESALALAREQASELRAARAQLERALAASTAEAAATIGALKASVEQHTAQALELEQQRCALANSEHSSTSI